MEASRFVNSGNDDQQRALEGLMDAFSSVFSLEEIADTYCKAEKNVAIAGAMLCNMQERTSTSSNSTTSSETSEISSESREMQFPKNGSYHASKTKIHPASMGTVSTVLGKSYWRPKSLASETGGTIKPLKLDQKDLPMSELWEADIGSAKDDAMRVDVEEFLVKMLGDGFKLERHVIHEVLGSCGYDIEKSMGKLLELSAMTEEEKDNGHHQIAKKCSEKKFKVEHLLFADRVLQTNGSQMSLEWKERSDVQKEVLTSLFNVQDRSQKSSVMPSPIIPINRFRTFEQSVVESLTLGADNCMTGSINQPIENDKESVNEDDSYKLLRKAVMEYRTMTKEYFKSAVEAFVKGDRDRADKLLKQGLFFQRKARETDEESEQMIFETRDDKAHKTMSLDLQHLGAREAVRLLQCHLSSLAGIPSITYLKVIIEGKEDDTSKGSRKRLIMRLLEKDSIKWAEEVDSGAILIRVDEINHKHLSFAKKG